MLAHVGTPWFDLPLLAAIAVAGAGAAVLLGLSLAALARRRSRSYLLVSLALAALLARAGVAATAMAGALGPAAHHLAEHGLDAVMAGLVIAAVYHARTVERRAGGGDAEGQELRSDGGPRLPTEGDDRGGDRP